MAVDKKIPRARIVWPVSEWPLFITDDNSIADIQGKLLQYLVQVMSLF